MRLVEQEQMIKRMVREDISNPEIYNCLQKMILMFLKRKKAPGNCQRYEEVSYTMAGDIYMKLLEGETVDYFLGYFDRKYKEYFREYYESEKYDIPFDPSLDEYMSLGQNFGVQDFHNAINKLYLEDIERVVDKVMEKCKYVKCSSAYINLKLSLMISILRNELTTFHLDEGQSLYLKFLIVAFYEEIKKSGIDLDETKA